MTQTADAEPRLTAKGRATRARIIEAASGLVAARGVAGTSIEDVRREAGVSGSQMSHYFTDKACLIRAVVTHQAAAVVEFQKPLIEHLDSFEALRAWADIAIEKQRAHHCQGGCEFGSLASELAETDDATRAELAVGFERWHAMIRDGLRTMRERGDLRPEADPEELALGLLAALQGGLLMTQAMRDTRPLEAAMNISLAHIRSLAAR
jgi:TetR/AcrR family transcriptional repressor of nem operon